MDGHVGTVDIGGSKQTNLIFADDIERLVASNQIRKNIEELCNGSQWRKYKNTNNNNDMTTEVQIAGITLEEVQSFKYLGTIISDEMSKPKVFARIAQATAALSSLKIVWRNRNITISSKTRLMRYLEISIFLYACQAWILIANLQRRIEAMETGYYRILLNISYTEQMTNEELHNRINYAIGPYEDLLTTVKRRKFIRYNHASRSSGQSNTILYETVNGSSRRGDKRKGLEITSQNGRV